MANFPRYDGHLYIDAYEGNIVRDWYIGRDLYVNDDAEIRNNLTVTGGNFRVNTGTATVYGSITTTVGDFIALSGDASLTNDTASAHGLTITSANVLGQPSIFLTESTGKTTTLKTTDTGLTEFWSDGNMKIGYESSTPQSLSIYAGAGTDPFASEAFQIATTNSSGTTFTDGTITFNASSDDMDFIVNTATIANAFKIDSGAFSSEFNTMLITKSDVYMETTNYSGLTTPGIRINHPGDRYENRLLTVFFNDFSVETTSFTGATPALRLNYASDTLTIKVPTTIESTLDVTGLTTTAGITNVGTIQNTGPLNNTGVLTQIGTANITGTLNQDGNIIFSNSTTNEPTLSIDNGTNNYEFLKAEFIPAVPPSVIDTNLYTFNPNQEYDWYMKVLDQFGSNLMYFSANASQVQTYANTFRFRGGKLIKFENAGGTDVAHFQLNGTDPVYEQTEGEFVLNPNGPNTATFIYGSSTYPYSGTPLFKLDEASDTITMSGNISATDLVLTNEPLKQYSDTTANLATKLTRDGEFAYDTNHDEMAMRSNGSNQYVLTPLVHSFTFNYPTATVPTTGPFNPVANGQYATSGVTALWDGYVVGFSVEVEDVPGVGVIADFRPRVNGTNLGFGLSAQVNATGNFEATATAEPNAFPISSGDRITAALEQIIGSPTNAMDDVIAQVYVVYKIPVQ